MKAMGRLASWMLILILSAGCIQPQATQAAIQVSVIADGQIKNVTLPAGSSVQKALEAAGLELGALDRTEPPIFTLLSNDSQVRVIRVEEKFEIVQEAIPYEIQTLRNESLPLEEEILIQKGKNGLREITYRRLFEDGVEVSSQAAPVKVVVIEAPVPEIRMVGIQSPFAPISIPGRIFYVHDGNIWMMEGSTGTRYALVTTGDADSRIFSLSEDGTWLLFTRATTEAESINRLWAASVDALIGNAAQTPSEDLLLDLGVENVIHFADWMPGSSNRVIFSTVEPRAAPPGWQANNDLAMTTFSSSGWTTKWVPLLEANSGGIYGWWGTKFLWNYPEGVLTYTRPDGIGWVDLETGVITSTFSIVPYNTHADWAWVPGVSWGPDGKVLYAVDHAVPPGSSAPEESPDFDLIALPAFSNTPLTLVSQVGMFAYPIASPLFTNFNSGEADYLLAYLQAIFPEQSHTSRYIVMVMDRDGSNRRQVFPKEEMPGIEPREFWATWSPQPFGEQNHLFLALIYEGNLWLVDVIDGSSFQVTGDGLITRLIWK